MALLYLQSYAISSYSLGFYGTLAAIDSALRSVGRISSWHRFAHFAYSLLLSLDLLSLLHGFSSIGQRYRVFVPCIHLLGGLTTRERGH